MLKLTAIVLQSLLSNGAFTEWSDGMPDHWSRFTGATTGNGPPATLRRGDGGGLVLAGDSATGSWPFLTQGFEATPGHTYYLSLAASVTGERVEAHQFAPQFVGIRFLDAAGNEVLRSTCPIRAPSLQHEEFPVRAPAAAVRGEVCIFLAHTGKLEVARVTADTYRPDVPAESLAVLARQMDRYYSYFALKDVDWNALVERHRSRLAGSTDPEEFARDLVPLLAELEDMHVFVQAPSGAHHYTHRVDQALNFDLSVVQAKLREARRIGSVGLVGRTEEGFGYAAVYDFLGAEEAYDEMAQEIRSLFDAPGILLDVRANRGGDEALAWKLAGLFADEVTPYARAQVRSGPAHADLVEAPVRSFAPAIEVPYHGPVVGLTGPGAASSGECFVQMIKALPRAVLVGQPTMGSSGNPAPVELPNGVRVFFSRWIGMELDGAVIEGRGVVPDVVVEHVGAGDPTFTAGNAELARLVNEEG